jgi:hypothetical protein
MADNITFTKGERVGFVYNNELKEGTFIEQKKLNKSDIVHVDYKGVTLIFSLCSIYKIDDNGNQNRNKKSTQN